MLRTVASFFILVCTNQGLLKMEITTVSETVPLNRGINMVEVHREDNASQKYLLYTTITRLTRPKMKCLCLFVIW